MPNPELKHLTVEFKLLDTASGNGGFEAYAATFGNKDEVGDIIVKGAFLETIPDFIQNGFVPFGHDWDSLPAAYITDAAENDTGLLIKGEFHSYPSAQAVRTWMLERMAAGKSVRMSIGYLVIQDNLTDQARFLLKLRLFETSFVNEPANPLALVLSGKGLPQAGQPFATHSETALAVVEDFVNRARGLKELRVKEGRTFSATNREKIAAIREKIAALTDELDALLAETETPKSRDNSEEAKKLFAEFIKLNLTRN